MREIGFGFSLALVLISVLIFVLEKPTTVPYMIDGKIYQVREEVANALNNKELLKVMSNINKEVEERLNGRFKRSSIGPSEFNSTSDRNQSK